MSFDLFLLSLLFSEAVHVGRALAVDWKRASFRRAHEPLKKPDSEQYGWNYFAVKSDVLYVKPDASADAVLKSDFHVMVQRDP